MSNLDPTSLQAYEPALGSAALHSLANRDLLQSACVLSPDVVDPFPVPGRIAGAVAGLTLGDALADRLRRRRSTDQRPVEDVVFEWLSDRCTTAGADRVTAATQTFVISAEAHLTDPFRAPATVAHDLVARRDTLRSPGHAASRSIRRLAQGAPWFEAGAGSYGDAVLPRAVAVGLAGYGRPESVGLAAALDAAVTHAHPRATASAAALAAIIAGLIARPEGQVPAEALVAVAASLDEPAVADRLLEAISGEPHFPTPFTAEAPDALLVALWAMTYADYRDVLSAAAAVSGNDRSTLAITGAIFGATYGIDAIPSRCEDVEGVNAYAVLVNRLASGQPDTGGSDGPGGGDATGADIWFLVDRSGSMSSIAEYVVSGFDGFFRRQREVAGEATVTVVQFDNAEPHKVLVDALPVAQVPSIAGRFEPRGMTPLYDAIGLLLDRAERHGGDDADQLVVILTDGYENASGEWTSTSIHQRIEQLKARGWTFVFLGANQDSYATGAAMAMSAGNVSNFAPSESGVAATYDGLDRTVREWRGKGRTARRRDADAFWDGHKEAEELE
jgi:ADP-ribosylglycohydrolase